MPANDRLLVLLRHGQSEWNLKNLFTGWRDVDLTPAGVEEAKEAGRRLKAHGITFDLAFTSALIRAQHTLDLTLAELGQTGLPESRDQALNERDYGDLVGLNKDDARKKWGEEQVHKWRRSYDVEPPGGESLKDTVARALPYYCQNILPAVLGGKRVLVAAHGNSLRALVMVLDRLTPETIPNMELATGVPLVYRLKPEFDRGLQGDPDRVTTIWLDLNHLSGGSVTLDRLVIRWFAELSNGSQDFGNRDVRRSRHASWRRRPTRPSRNTNFSPRRRSICRWSIDSIN